MKTAKRGIFGSFKGTLAGFLGGICFIVLLALSQQKSRYDNPNDIYSEFEYFYRKAQDKQFKIFTASPTLNQLENGEMVILSSTTKNIFTRIENSLFFVVLRST